jgi:hypothetical protein
MLLWEWPGRSLLHASVAKHVECFEGTFNSSQPPYYAAFKIQRTVAPHNRNIHQSVHSMQAHRHCPKQSRCVDPCTIWMQSTVAAVVVKRPM